MFVDSLSGLGRQVATIEGLVTKGAGQSEKLGQAGTLDLQVRCRFDITGQQA